MNQELETKVRNRDLGHAASADVRALPVAARAAMVNRTHRIIRERATTLQARKKTVRGLLIPAIVSAGLLFAVVCAAWVMLDEYDAAPVGMPDSSQQIFVLMLWCLPISVAALAAVAFRRAGSKADTGGRR